MEPTNELRDSLNRCFQWNKARITLFSQMLLALIITRTVKTGEWRHEIRPIKIKTHGRAAISLFRYGLDYIVQAIVSVFSKFDLFKTCLARIEIPNTTG